MAKSMTGAEWQALFDRWVGAGAQISDDLGARFFVRRIVVHDVEGPDGAPAGSGRARTKFFAPHEERMLFPWVDDWIDDSSGRVRCLGSHPFWIDGRLSPEMAAWVAGEEALPSPYDPPAEEEG